jgi:hypothetical protein
MARDINALKGSILKAKAALEQAFGELETLGDEAKSWPGEIARVVPANLNKDMVAIANIVEGTGPESLNNLIEFLDNLPAKAYADGAKISPAEKMRQLAQGATPVPATPAPESLGTGAPVSAIAQEQMAESIIDSMIAERARSNYNRGVAGIDMKSLAEAGVGADKEGLHQLRELMNDVDLKPENVRTTVKQADRALEEDISAPVNLNDFVRSSIREANRTQVGGLSFDQLKESGIGVKDDFMNEFKVMQKKSDTKGALNEIASKVAAAQKDRKLTERTPEFIAEPVVPPKEVVSMSASQIENELNIPIGNESLSWSDIGEAPGSIDTIPDIGMLVNMELRDPVAEALKF